MGAAANHRHDGTAAAPAVVPDYTTPANGATVFYDARAVSGFTTSAGGWVDSSQSFAAYPDDGWGTYSQTPGAVKTYKSIYASSFALHAPSGGGLDGTLNFRIRRVSDNALVYNQNFSQVGGGLVANACTLVATLPLDTYVVQIIFALDGGTVVGFDGIAAHQ